MTLNSKKAKRRKARLVGGPALIFADATNFVGALSLRLRSGEALAFFCEGLP
jgi:hypothetical protein